LSSCILVASSFIHVVCLLLLLCISLNLCFIFFSHNLSTAYPLNLNLMVLLLSIYFILTLYITALLHASTAIFYPSYTCFTWYVVRFPCLGLFAL
jgi:hypothetical protein